MSALIQEADRCPVQFSTASAALAWADETLSKSGLRDHIGKLQKVTGGLTRDEVVLWALTISNALSGIEPRQAGWMYRFVYGDSQAVSPDDVARFLTPEMARWPCSRRKTPTQLHNLAVAMLGVTWADLQCGQRVPVPQIAYMLGLSRSTMRNDTWVALRSESRQQIGRWVDLVEQRLTESLRVKGVLE